MWKGISRVYGNQNVEFKPQVMITLILAQPVGSKHYTTLANASENRLGYVLPQGYNIVAYVLL